MMKTAQVFLLGLFLAAMTSLTAQVKTITPDVCPADPCPCEGGFESFSLYYFGEDNVDIDVFRNNGSYLITSFTNVMSGDLLTVDGSGLPGGILSIYTYFSVTTADKETCMTRIYSRCPSNAWPGAQDDLRVLGKTFGDFTVYSYTDLENSMTCTIANADQDWHVGGNVVEAPQNTMGTRNDEAVDFITNDQVRGTITNTGDFGMGTATPDARLDVHGDVIIEETLDVNGITRVNDNSSSTTPANGALIVAGGVGVGENINVGDELDVTNDAHVGGSLGVNTDTPDARLDVHGDAVIEETLDVNGVTSVNDNSSSTSPANGALIVAGGVGVGENVNVGDELDVTNDAHVGGNLGVNTDTPDARLDVHGDAIIESTLDVDGITSINNGAQSVNTSTGALRVNGGAGIGLNLNVGQDLNVAQDADISGNGYIAGNLGVGTTSPSQKLHVVGNRMRLGNLANTRFVDIRIDGTGNDINSAGQDLFIRSFDGENVYINSQPNDGRVGIGTTTIPTGYLLAVDGNIICEEVRVQLSQNWPDYVFAKDYDLKPLTEVEAEIKTIGHLPDTPSAAEMENNGIQLSQIVTTQQKTSGGIISLCH